MLSITLTRRGMTTRQLRGFKKYIKSAMIWRMKLWFKETLPKHFLPQADWIYRYQKRSKAYNKRKDRRGLTPLQFTGKSKRKILSHYPDPKGSAKRMRMRIKVTGPFGKTYPGWKRGHTMSKELTKLTRKEMDVIAKDVEDYAQRLMTEESQFERMVYRG